MNARLLSVNVVHDWFDRT